MAKKTEAVMWLGSEDSYSEYTEIVLRISTVSSGEIANIEAKMFDEQEEREHQSPLIEVTEGIAVITINGSLTNMTQSWLLHYGLTPYSMIYDAIIEAALDDKITDILLSIDSNGGTVAGISHALEGIREAAQIKNIYTHTASNMNSAAYWIGSAGTIVMADRMAEVGSIGVIAVLMDYTKAMEDDGVKPHVFRAGEFKALGMPYEKLTEKAAKVIQDRIEARYDQFLEDVAVNRGSTKNNVKSNMAEGRVFLAEDALSVGLIDKVMSFNDSFRLIRAEATQSDINRLDGSRGLGAHASDTELPIQSQEGEDMTRKKKVVTEQVQAAVAEGVELNTALEAVGAEVDDSADGAVVEEVVDKDKNKGAKTPEEIAAEAGNKTPEEIAAEAGNKTPEEIAAEAAAEKPVATADATASLLAMVDKVGTLSQSLADATSEVKTLKAEATTAKAGADVALAQVESLKQIACDSIARMGIAIGMAVQDTSKLSAENVLALHESTRADFNKRFPVGQHVDSSESDAAVDEAAEKLNQHLAGLTTTDKQQK